MAVVAVGKPFEFEIGSPEDEDGRESDERIHAVRLDHSYAIATREVNQGAVRAISRIQPPGRPVREGEYTTDMRALPDCRRRLAGRGRVLQLAQPARKPPTVLRASG